MCLNYVTYLMKKQELIKAGKYTMKSSVAKLLQFLLEESQTQKIGPSKSYRWKEELMQAVQNGLRASADFFESQDEYENFVDQEIEKLKEDLDLTLSMIGRALYQVPFQAFKVPKSK